MVNTIYWFRKALRLHDNPSLVQALQNASHVTPVFCLDPWFVKSGSVGANRMQFLLESLEDLDTRLGKLDSRLLVLQGNPLEELPRIFNKEGYQPRGDLLRDLCAQGYPSDDCKGLDARSAVRQAAPTTGPLGK